MKPHLVPPGPRNAGTEPVLGPLPETGLALLHVPTPAEDRALSPFTGLVRAHWVAVADDLLLSAARYASPAGARIDLPGRPSQQGTRTDGLEGFARTFLLAAFLHAGGDGTDPHGHLGRYLGGLVAGTRTPGADDGESWPVVGHVGRDGQPHVEAASIALSLHLTRGDSWARLAADEQDQVAGWLRGALDQEPSSNNWYLFPLTIASFLEAVGRADARTAHVIARGLALLEQWYRGDGWYSDGDGEAFDHYVGWALHLYPLLHARLRGEETLERKLAGRLREFLVTFARTFDRNGAPLYQGRSMTYRTATLAAVALGEVAGASPLSHGQSRRVLSAGLRYFLERGARQDGILTLGWHGPHEPTLQRYSGPASPYWASKGFAALALPSDHPVWTATEEALPADTDDAVLPAGPTGLLVQATAGDGIVRVHNHGSDHLKPHEADAGAADPLYARFAYSTRTGPTAQHNPSDNDVQVRVRGIWSVRRRVHAVAQGPDWAASWHAPRFAVPGPFHASDTVAGGSVLPSTRIESVTLARGATEVRVHRLRGFEPGTAVRLAGWAVAAAGPEGLRTSGPGPTAGTGDISVTAHPEGLTSSLAGVSGWTEAGWDTAPYGTAFGPWAVVPRLGSVTAGGALPTTLLVALARLTADAESGPLNEAAAVHLDTTGAGRGALVLTVDWRDGLEPTRLDVGALPWPTRW